MDKYTKGILTVIAIGIIGLNVQMMNGGGLEMTYQHSMVLRQMKPTES